MTPASSIEVARIDAAAAERELDALALILADTVEGGASVGFVTPFSTTDAAAWWRSLLPDVAAGRVLLLGARVDGALLGTVQLHPSSMPNGRFRAEVAKLLVHPLARRKGVGRELMEKVEALARERGHTTLVLDTQTGSDAERLYLALGWTAAGVIPDYSLLSDGTRAATTYMYKQLA
jgi:GNAT superfamily N-acetyltransferase